jgi:hypothetical protein
MIARAPIIFVLLVTVLATESTAEVVYTLVSPNEQLNGYFGDSVSGARILGT